MTMESLPDTSVEFFTSPWSSSFYNLINSVQSELLIASPFISKRPVEQIVEIVQSKQSSHCVSISILTNLAVNNLLSGSLDITALVYLVETIPGSTVTYLPNLHAKIYIADTKAAVVTSANLTNSGMAGNYEYGVLLQDPSLVRQVRTDLTKYALLGNQVSLDTLTTLAQATEELGAIRRQSDRSIKAKLKATFEQRIDSTQLELLKTRAKGKTTHGILCDTILYLLEQKGPLKTVELHPLVQQIHPDLCDDSIDRVIDGVHFGKKWKHYVRNAQQALKRREDIDFDGERWFLIGFKEVNDSTR